MASASLVSTCADLKEILVTLWRFVTTDKTCVHHITHKTKQQSMQWKQPDLPPPRKAKVIKVAGKVMAPGVCVLLFFLGGTTTFLMVDFLLQSVSNWTILRDLVADVGQCHYQVPCKVNQRGADLLG